MLQVYDHPVAPLGHSSAEYHYVTLPAPPWVDGRPLRQVEPEGPESFDDFCDRVLAYLRQEGKPLGIVAIYRELGECEDKTRRALFRLIGAGLAERQTKSGPRFKGWEYLAL